MTEARLVQRGLPPTLSMAGAHRRVGAENEYCRHLVPALLDHHDARRVRGRSTPFPVPDRPPARRTFLEGAVVVCPVECLQVRELST